MRLVTRADFDGLVCGALVTKFENVDDYLFVEPKFLQDGLVDIRNGDIITNLPYHPNCTLWFDHHITNTTPDFPQPIVLGKGGFRLAPSAARVVYEYYTEVGNRHQATGNSKIKAEEIISFLGTERVKYLMHEADRIDAGKLEQEDVLNPQGYVLISMTTDGRNAGDEPYWLKIIGLLRDASLEEPLPILKSPGAANESAMSRINCARLLLARAEQRKNVIYVDLRGVKEIPDGNRFLIFTLFPQGNIQVKVTHDSQRENTTAISVGYNIFNPTSKSTSASC